MDVLLMDSNALDDNKKAISSHHFKILSKFLHEIPDNRL